METASAPALFIARWSPASSLGGACSIKHLSDLQILTKSSTSFRVTPPAEKSLRRASRCQAGRPCDHRRISAGKSLAVDMKLVYLCDTPWGKGYGTSRSVLLGLSARWHHCLPKRICP